MKHEVSYIFTDKYNSVRSIIERMHCLGYDFDYKELQMADGTVHKFRVCIDKWVELPDMDAVLKWLCADIYLLKDAYDDCILREEHIDA